LLLPINLFFYSDSSENKLHPQAFQNISARRPVHAFLPSCEKSASIDPQRHYRDGRLVNEVSMRSNMNQGEMDYQSAADQSRAGLAILLLLGRAMPWLVFFAVATLGSTLPEQLNPTPARLGWLAASYFLPAALLSAQAVHFVQKRGTRQGLIVVFLITAAALQLHPPPAGPPAAMRGTPAGLQARAAS